MSDQIELARRVRTPEGARLYGSPIGSLIGNNSEYKPEPRQGPRTPSAPKDAVGRTTGSPSRNSNSDAPEREVTIERLRSLQQQVKAAARTDNEVALRAAKSLFTQAFTQFAENRAPDEVLLMLAAPGKTT